MLCKKCNAEIEDGATFCPYCAANLTEGAPKNIITDMLSDKLFLVMCILLSVGVGLGVIAGSFNVLGILTLIFMWLTFSNVKSGNDIKSHMRGISGTIYAEYVITLVVTVIIGVCLLLCIFAFSFMGSEFYEEFAKGFAEGLDTSGVAADLSVFKTGKIAIGLILAIVFIVMAILIVGIISTKKIHSFAKELYQCLDTPECITKAASGRTWIIVSAVFSGMSVVSDAGEGLIAFLAAGCNTAIYVLAAILINKYLLSEQNTQY